MSLVHRGPRAIAGAVGWQRRVGQALESLYTTIKNLDSHPRAKFKVRRWSSHNCIFLRFLQTLWGEASLEAEVRVEQVQGFGVFQTTFCLSLIQLSLKEER